MKHFVYLLLLLVATGCERDEIPVDYTVPSFAEGTVIRQIDMSSDYRYRTYYDLETNAVVAVHEKGDWDLAFASQTGETDIRLNSSKLMYVRKTEGPNFDEVTSFAGDGPRYDKADGTASAMGDWTPGAIYVVDQGVDEVGEPQGRAKIEILGMDDLGWTLRVGSLSDNVGVEYFIPKDATRNVIHFSFTEGALALEPPREDWDLLFTHYTLFFDDLFGQQNIYYLVAGVLSNPYQVQTQDLTLTDFDAIDVDYASSVQLSTARDGIGYDWKEFELAGESYSIIDNAFLLQSVEGSQFKLQFTSFLDQNGDRGAPTFQFARLN